MSTVFGFFRQLVIGMDDMRFLCVSLCDMAIFGVTSACEHCLVDFLVTFALAWDVMLTLEQILLNVRSDVR